MPDLNKMVMERETEPEDKLAGAKSQGQAQFDSILEMVEALRKAQEAAEGDGISRADELREQAEQRIHEDALSVEVRSDWYAPGATHNQDNGPAEYRILLCTGGPACQLVGELDDHCEPVTVRMQVQDWGTLWTDYRPSWMKETQPVAIVALEDDTSAVLLDYARCFWFGE